MADTKKLSIIAFSGDYDKLTAVFTLGTGAAAVGYEVNIFFTFWGLDAIKQKHGRAFIGSNWLTKTFGYMMGGLKVTPASTSMPARWPCTCWDSPGKTSSPR